MRLNNMKSKCCNQPAIHVGKSGKYFCGGINGCGKWCDVIEDTPVVKKNLITETWRDRLKKDCNFLEYIYHDEKGNGYTRVEDFITTLLEKQGEEYVEMIKRCTTEETNSVDQDYTQTIYLNGEEFKEKILNLIKSHDKTS